MLLLLLLACANPEGSAKEPYVDTDGDGYAADDCDESDPAVHPGVEERCDGRDEDCSGVADDNAVDRSNYYLDEDGDGYGVSGTSSFGCAPPGATSVAGDCDDTNPLAWAGAAEACTALEDLNCDGELTGIDADGDGYAACEDCDEANPDIHPGAAERCDEANADEDCDGLRDDDDSADPATMSLFYADVDEDGHGAPESAISACDPPPGFVATGADCDDGAPETHPTAAEVCDGVDDDCDGLADDADPDVAPSAAWHPDVDLDGYGAADDTLLACLAPSGWIADDHDCNDADATIHPGVDEVCDWQDNDCDGLMDDDDDLVTGPAYTWYLDEDGDRFGDPDRQADACAPPSGFVGNSDDCDDSDADVNPDGAEVCDDADQDEDCDGYADDADPSATGYALLYVDVDGDGYGGADVTGSACDAGEAEAPRGGDCDDSRADVNPRQTEVCDADDADEDCDGLVDDDDFVVDGFLSWHADLDGDGHGALPTLLVRCDAGPDLVADGTDCNDEDATTYAGAPELCDGTDNDCDEVEDDADSDVSKPFTWYRDYDGDGYGDPANLTLDCESPLGYLSDGTDCDDRDDTRHPTAADTTADGVDSDCDGLD